MPKLILHAGFAKTGSSTIQAAIRQNFRQLRKNGIYVLGDKLEFPTGRVCPTLPLWFLEEADKNFGEGETLTKKVEQTLDRLEESDALLITAENLSRPSVARLFAGVDSAFNVQIIYYMRPQFDWIPSAWKQWGMKAGISVDDYVKHSLKHKRPFYLESLRSWENAVPEASIVVRPLKPPYLQGGDLVTDFFDFVGLKDFSPLASNVRTNPSLDFSLLYLLSSKHKKFFQNAHDNRITDALLRKIPNEYKQTNIDMLSYDQRARIAEFFRQENMEIARDFVRVEDPETFYESFFEPRPTERSYSDVSAEEALTRAFKIIVESFGPDRGTEILSEFVSDLTAQ